MRGSTTTRAATSTRSISSTPGVISTPLVSTIPTVKLSRVDARDVPWHAGALLLEVVFRWSRDAGALLHIRVESPNQGVTVRSFTVLTPQFIGLVPLVRPVAPGEGTAGTLLA